MITQWLVMQWTYCTSVPVLLWSHSDWWCSELTVQVSQYFYDHTVTDGVVNLLYKCSSTSMIPQWLMVQWTYCTSVPVLLWSHSDWWCSELTVQVSQYFYHHTVTDGVVNLLYKCPSTSMITQWLMVQWTYCTSVPVLLWSHSDWWCSELTVQVSQYFYDHTVTDGVVNLLYKCSSTSMIPQWLMVQWTYCTSVPVLLWSHSDWWCSELTVQVSQYFYDHTVTDGVVNLLYKCPSTSMITQWLMVQWTYCTSVQYFYDHTVTDGVVNLLYKCSSTSMIPQWLMV